MEKYKPNSYAYKESKKEDKEDKEERKINAIVSKETKTKKNDVRKFKNAFISKDVGDVKSYVFGDVLIPSLKKLVYDAIKYTMEMLLFDKSKASNSSPFVSYRSYSSDFGSQDRFSNSNIRNTTSFNYDDIIFQTRSDGEATLMEMENIIDSYGIVSVSDLFDLAGQQAPYTSNKYGWTNLRNADVIRVREGYVIKLPRALPID